MPFWEPQKEGRDGKPNPQIAACTCPADIIFFGGTRGGGKSDALLGRQLRGCEKYGQDWNGLVIRKKFKDFKELRRRIDGLIRNGLPAKRKGGDNQTNTVEFTSGASFILTAIGLPEILDDFVGHQYTEISVDEAPNFPFIGQLIDKLKGSLRSPVGVPCQMFLTGNPGGPGASMIKLMFMDGKIPGKIYQTKIGNSVENAIFIKSTLDDNRILCENDPKYVNRLKSIKDPLLRGAWLEGDWTAFIGQAFHFFEEIHVLKESLPNSSIPAYAPIYCTFDWGWSRPFSFGWWWVDTENRIYRHREWYGWDGSLPDSGLKMTDSEIAQGMIEREVKMGFRDPDTKESLAHRKITYLCDPTCFNKKPDYRGGGQGTSTTEEFAEFGIEFRPGDPSRILKIRQFRERLAVPEDGSQPMMMVDPSCKEFIRTIPSLCLDDYNPEDVDTDQEDHIYDEACHICMARPIKFDIEAAKAEIKRQQDEAKINQMDSLSRVAWQERAEIKEKIEEEDELEKEMAEEYFENLFSDL